MYLDFDILALDIDACRIILRSGENGEPGFGSTLNAWLTSDGRIEPHPTRKSLNLHCDTRRLLGGGLSTAAGSVTIQTVDARRRGQVGQKERKMQHQ